MSYDCTLKQQYLRKDPYRNTDENGDPYVGPTYYMEKGLGEEKNFKY
jgi:Na+/alanine symporter